MYKNIFTTCIRIYMNVFNRILKHLPFYLHEPEPEVKFLFQFLFFQYEHFHVSKTD